MNRREFLFAAAALAGSGLLPTTVLANDFWSRPRYLWLRRASTGEEIREVYWFDGKLYQPGYQRICHLLRDVRAGVSADMSIVLLDILRGSQGWFEAYGQSRIIVVNSGLRTPETNEAIEGAAKNSLHKDGRASDITIPGVPVDYIGNLGRYLAGGGVGFYRSKRFVHVDDGRLRTWRG